MQILENALNQGIAPAIIVSVYLLIARYFDNKKENNSIKLTSSLIDSINEISNFLKGITKDIINKDKEKCRNAINDAVIGCRADLIHFVAETIVNNHIESNKDNILSNIKNIVNVIYYSIYSKLSIYKYNGIEVSSHMNEKWKEELEKDITNTIYNNGMTAEKKILTFSNKIEIRLHGYVNYLTNNTIQE